MSVRFSRGIAGFTLIELNLVVVLIAILSLTIYGSFSMGAKVWQRVRVNTPQIDVQIFLEKISMDMSNCLSSSLIVPFGNAQEFSCALFDDASGTSGASGVYGRLRYVFDKEKGVILRSFQDARQLGQTTPASQREMVRNITGCVFTYYYFDTELKSGTWRDTLTGSLPSAVKVAVSFIADTKNSTLSKIITVHPGK